MRSPFFVALVSFLLFASSSFSSKNDEGNGLNNYEAQSHDASFLNQRYSRRGPKRHGAKLPPKSDPHASCNGGEDGGQRSRFVKLLKSAREAVSCTGPGRQLPCTCVAVDSILPRPFRSQQHTNGAEQSSADQCAHSADCHCV